jgi:hypothetical protein
MNRDVEKKWGERKGGMRKTNTESFGEDQGMPTHAKRQLHFAASELTFSVASACPGSRNHSPFLTGGRRGTTHLLSKTQAFVQKAACWIYVMQL